MVTRRAKLLRLVKLTVSLVLVGALVRAADWRAVLDEARRLDPAWLVVSLVLFMPQTVLSAWRWQQWLAPLAQLTLGQSLRHTLLANAWNLIVPAKGGDFSKAACLTQLSTAERARAAGRVMIEKCADVACLFVCMALSLGGWPTLVAGLTLLGVIVFAMSYDLRSRTRQSSGPLQLQNPRTLASSATKITRALLATAGLWTLHLLQIHAFLLAAGVDTPLTTTLLRAPLALFAGLVPGTFCGIGTRDSALVYLYADTAPAATMAVVGLLTSLRYLIPGAAGVAVMLFGGDERSARPDHGEAVELGGMPHARGRQSFSRA